MADQIWVLKILSGPHIGAEITLNSGKHSLGQHEECDLVLTDNTLADYHLEIHVSDEGIEIRNLVEDQGIYLNGKAQENSFSLEPFVIVTAGNLHFAMGPEDAEWPEMNMPNLASSAQKRPITEDDDSTNPAENGHESEHENGHENEHENGHENEHENISELDDQLTTRESKFSRFIDSLSSLRRIVGKKFLIAGGVVLLLIGFGSTFFWAWQITDPALAKVGKPIPSILIAETLRASHKLEDVTLKTLPGNMVLLTGYVVDSSTKKAYLDAMNEKNVSYNNQIVALDKMLESAETTLAMRNYKTISVALDTLPGTLVLKGYLDTGKELIKIRKLLSQEVHGLRAIIDHLEFQNTRIKSLRSMLKEKGLSQRIRLLDQDGKVTLNGRLMNISQGYHLKDVIRVFREKYGNRPELVIEVTMPSSNTGSALSSANMEIRQPVINIKSVTIGKVPFVVLNNDEKYLVGAKLQNGYILESITLEYLIIRLGQEKIKYYVGGKYDGS